MIVATTESLAGYRIIKALGLVKGNTIRAKSIGKDIIASIKNITGGEIEEYTQMIAESREQAIDRMVENAAQLGANAVVGLRFSTTSVMSGAAEILAYGTAVMIESV
ncbi:YbjQ family protein [Candidatus Fermentibacteria bacterium]|nr:YbjQ family protein [Candidatus Fermentibacteria bacterium]